MTDLQEMYKAARTGRTANGRPRSHYAALRHLARLTGIDPETVDRCLKRARRTDVLEEKRAKTAKAVTA